MSKKPTAKQMKPKTDWENNSIFIHIYWKPSEKNYMQFNILKQENVSRRLTDLLCITSQYCSMPQEGGKIRIKETLKRLHSKPKRGFE